jgi:hypothetical protein
MTPWRMLPPDFLGTKSDLPEAPSVQTEHVNLIPDNAIVNSLE